MNLKELKRAEIIKKAVGTLKSDGLVIYPTETLYGIGADATSKNAIEKLLEYKSKREGKPISIVCADQEMAERYVELNSDAMKFYKNFLPGPVTVISKAKQSEIYEKVKSSSGTLGIRIPDYPLIREICEKFWKPFTATSANASGKKKPYKTSDILDNISKKQKGLIDLIIDAGELPKNQASTVVDTTVGETTVLRSGEIELKFQHSRTTNFPDETIEFAVDFTKSKINNSTNRCLIFALQGEMGVGKTIFTKGLAKALGINEIIKSPTYTVSNEYGFGDRQKLFHIDTWRMSSPNDLESIGLQNMVKPKNIIVIEWADRFSDVIERYAHLSVIYWIDIEAKSENERFIRF